MSGDPVIKAISTGDLSYLRYLDNPDQLTSVEKAKLINIDHEDFVIYAPCHKKGLARYLFGRLEKVRREKDADYLLDVIDEMRRDNKDLVFLDPQICSAFFMGITGGFSDDIVDKTRRVLKGYIENTNDISAHDSHYIEIVDRVMTNRLVEEIS